MLKTFTFVRMKPGIDRETFYERWCAHTRDFDLRDHPEISLNRLILFETPPPGAPADCVGVAENHWPDRAAVEEAIAWYQTPPGIEHNRDLEEFMDIAQSPTFIVENEVEVSSEHGVAWKTGPADG
jgi:hypothetical protein